MLDFKFSSLADFINMSGHGVYVWSCTVIMLACFIFLVMRPLMLHRAALQHVRKQARLKEQQSARHNAERETTP